MYKTESMSVTREVKVLLTKVISYAVRDNTIGRCHSHVIIVIKLLLLEVNIHAIRECTAGRSHLNVIIVIKHSRLTSHHSHQKTHIEEKPCKCDKCDKSFA